MLTKRRHLEITTKIKCPIACAYCPQKTFVEAYMKRSDVVMMDFEVFKRCIDKVPQDVIMDFSGMCEPWQNPECTKMVLYAHENGHKIFVFTTLVGMKTEDIDLLELIPFGYFSVHLPGNDKREMIVLNDYYLNVLKRLIRSKIDAVYHYHGTNASPVLQGILGDKLLYCETSTRARNISDTICEVSRRRGVIACERAMRYSVLLPNGDVVLCCMDYSLKHVLGNLLAHDYQSLFEGEEYLKVKEGLKKESAEILCRYCDSYVKNVDLKAHFCNYFLPAFYRKIKKAKQFMKR